jgi:hypothetical protein
VSKEKLDVLEEMGVPVKQLVTDLKAAVKAHTVTTGEGGKPLAKPIVPTKEERLALASKLVQGSHLAGVEKWLEEQLVSLV